MTQNEFETILADTTKRIEGDIVWKKDDFTCSPMNEYGAKEISNFWKTFLKLLYGLSRIVFLKCWPLNLANPSFQYSVSLQR